jgi:hypothetical protein
VRCDFGADFRFSALQASLPAVPRDAIATHGKELTPTLPAYSEGDYPGLDKGSRSFYSRLRQGGFALCVLYVLFVSVMGQKVSATIAPAKSVLVTVPENIVIGDATVKPNSGLGPHQHPDGIVCGSDHVDHYLSGFFPAAQIPILWKVEGSTVPRFIRQFFVVLHLPGNDLDDGGRFTVVFNDEIDKQRLRADPRSLDS